MTRYYKDYDTYGFKRSELEKLLGIHLSNNIQSEAIDKDELPIEWAEFAGKDTALMFIAGMAIALEKSSSGFRHGSKMNKSAIANAAIKAINDYGHGTMITPKSLTELINEALRKHTSNMDDFSQQERE